jgi:glycine/D-amino acid oxidase-like deaminating enzyme
MFLDRRSFLGSLAFASACSTRRAQVRTPATPQATRQFARVNISADRVIRTVVGLRPYRPSGFVVRRESLAEKTIVHNYGHGGGGVTLSWGTAHLAVEQALPTGARQMAVVGSGAVGLATARLLQEHGIDVTIYTKALPPDTTSNIAGAQVLPVTVFERERVTPEFLAQFVEAAQFSYRRYQLMVGDYYGIRWRPNYTLSHEPIEDGFLTGKQGLLASVMPELRNLTPQEHPFPFRYVRQFDTMFIYPSHYLEAMLREFRIAGGKIVLQEMHDLREVAALPQAVIMNCTGLGAKALFNDAELTPIKGQLTILLPQPEVDYATLPPDGLYMFSRPDGVLLGGTHEMGNWDLAPNREAETRIVAAHTQIFRDMHV